MFLFDLFRSFLPIHNPIGFGAADFLEFVLALVLVAFALTFRPFVWPLVVRVSQRRTICVVLLACLPVVLRLALLQSHPIPAPEVSDDFSYLLLADTFRLFRLANPVHPFHQFFETFFVLQQPSYSSIFPPGQGLLLAVFGGTWAGVAFSVAALAALTYWMLRGWVSTEWAFAGGLFAGLQFGPLNQWMNSFWGGALSAIAGCLVFGALPRLNRGPGYAVVLGCGLALQMVTRPFEFVFLFAATLVYLSVKHRRSWKPLLTALACLVPALLLLALHNHAVTGSALTLPYQTSRYQYGVPAAFTFQANVTPHRQLTREQQLNYEVQSEVHGTGTDSAPRFISRLVGRARYLRFFLTAPLYVGIIYFFFTVGERRSRWILASIFLFAVGTNIYPYFYPHYVAALTPLLVLAAIIGLRRTGESTRRAIVYVTCFHFVFWYGAHLADLQPLQQWETWVNINRSHPNDRAEIEARLARAPGKQLVFVRYSSRHAFEEWVHNTAAIDGQRVVWARDLGTEEDAKLRAYYPNRTPWLLEPDNSPPALSGFDTSATPVMEQVP